MNNLRIFLVLLSIHVIFIKSSPAGNYYDGDKKEEDEEDEEEEEYYERSNGVNQEQFGKSKDRINQLQDSFRDRLDIYEKDGRRNKYFRCSQCNPIFKIPIIQVNYVREERKIYQSYEEQLADVFNEDQDHYEDLSCRLFGKECTKSSQSTTVFSYAEKESNMREFRNNESLLKNSFLVGNETNHGGNGTVQSRKEFYPRTQLYPVNNQRFYYPTRPWIYKIPEIVSDDGRRLVTDYTFHHRHHTHHPFNYEQQMFLIPFYHRRPVINLNIFPNFRLHPLNRRHYNVHNIHIYPN